MVRKIRMLRQKRRSDQGWGLFEILLAIVLSAMITGIIAMGARQALDNANAGDCSKNLILIEGAKRESTRDHPGVPLRSLQTDLLRLRGRLAQGEFERYKAESL